jgi:hypothetical protein
MMKTKEAKNKNQNMEDLFPFHKENYKYLFLGLILLALGFILMIGGGSDDPNVFSNSIFDTQRLTIAPLLLIAGFAVEMWAVLKRPSEKK